MNLSNKSSNSPTRDLLRFSKPAKLYHRQLHLQTNHFRKLRLSPLPLTTTTSEMKAVINGDPPGIATGGGRVGRGEKGNDMTIDSDSIGSDRSQYSIPPLGVLLAPLSPTADQTIIYPEHYRSLPPYNHLNQLQPIPSYSSNSTYPQGLNSIMTPPVHPWKGVSQFTGMDVVHLPGFYGAGRVPMAGFPNEIAHNLVNMANVAERLHLWNILGDGEMKRYYVITK